MAPFESLSTVSYSHFVATLAVSLSICEIFNDKDWRDLENWVMICLRSLKMVPFESLGTTSYYIFALRSNYGSILYHCRVEAREIGRKSRSLHTPLHSSPPLDLRRNVVTPFGVK